MRGRIMRIARLALGIGVALSLAACASTGGNGSSASEGSSAKSTSTKAPRGVAPPKSSPLARVSLGMTPDEVRQKIGSPTSEQSYVTGKAWIPFYYGPDTARTDWKYKGQGRVVFSRNQYSGSVKVIRIDYDPSEDGQ
jgi:outer membrane protein assembly factor BamE (lipoprotein component of BamABCDE complex)